MKLRAGCLLVVCSGVWACGSSTPSPAVTVTGYQILSVDGTPLTAVVGEAKRLSVVQVMSDGTTAALSTTARVTWTDPPTVTALAGGSMPSSSVLPQPTQKATAVWIQNPEHFMNGELSGVLWVLDSGTDPQPAIAVTASVTDVSPIGQATVTVAIGPMPAGDAGRGQVSYTSNCAQCHGATGQGTADFPGLNNATDHVAGDPAWNASLMAITAQSDMDNLGVSLDPSMPKWLNRLGATSKYLTPADFADIYAFLKTQTQ